MAKQVVDTGKLDARERWLLRLENENAFRRRCLVSLDTLRLWVSVGLPCHKIMRGLYFDPVEVEAWLGGTSCDEAGTNLDLIWDATPIDAVPREDFVTADGRHWWLIPADKRPSTRQRAGKANRKQLF